MNQTPERPPISRKHMLRRSGLVTAGAGVVALLLHVGMGWAMALRLGWLLLCLGAIWLATAVFASDEPMSAKQRRYLREFFPAMAAYLVMVFAFRPLLGMVDSTILKALIAMLPVLPIVFVVRAMVRKLLEGDELERRMQLEAVSMAGLGVGLLSFAAGFLNIAGLFRVQHALILVLPALFLAYGLALMWVRRRYQGE